MAEVKWIKITTDMFEDEKIDFIQSLPEADAMLIIWVRLLAMAGKCNRGGYIYLTESIPYTDDMLAHKFKKPLNIVKLALQTFIRLEMIEATDKGLYVVNWNKHQNVEGLDKIRLQTKKRVDKFRDKQKQLAECNVTSNATVTGSNETEEDLDLELDKEKDTITRIEKLWSLYPNKKGKASAMKSIPKLLKSIGYEKLEKCIELFVKENKKTDIKFIQHGSTFFNGGYMDYLETTKATTKSIIQVVEVPYEY